MAKSNNTKQNKSDHVVKKKKGRPKKKTSKLNSPSKHIEKEEKKGRGRPRKNPIQKKITDPMQTSIINKIHENNYSQDFGRSHLYEDTDVYRPDQNAAFHLPSSRGRLEEEILVKREYIEKLSKIKTRRSQRLAREESNKSLTTEERLRNIEEMVSSLGMMVLALHKKTVNKVKKNMVDDWIRKGYNAETARSIKENMYRDQTYFEKTRKNSSHFMGNESLISEQRSVKQ